jgi:hypothetical protein
VTPEQSAEMQAAARADNTEGVVDLVLALLALASAVPLLYVHYPPIEDLPQHLAAVRVLHDFHDPTFGFSRFFQIDLLRTQYLAFYLAADVLAYVTGVEPAVRLLAAAALVATPFATRSLLRALGKDGALALLVLPLSYNAHLVLGFFNFLLAIPLSFYGVALAIRQRRAFSQKRAVGLSLLALLCFYSHVVPFALMALGIGLVSLSRQWRNTLRALLPLAPAGVASLIWLHASPAGQATLTAAAGAKHGPAPEYLPFEYAWQQLPVWLTNVLADDIGLHIAQAWAALCGLIALLAVVDRFRSRAQAAPDALGRSLAWRLLLLPPLCALLYFVAPGSYAWIWPIAQRFPLLAALWLVICLPRFRLGRLPVITLASALAAASFHYVGVAFAAVEREEVDAASFERALARIPPGQRVVGLMFNARSRYVGFAPFIHFVAYYQARKGGAVMFTFADFPQSPFRFRADNRPPRVPPRWEWMPERVRPHLDLDFYDYALVRGGPGLIASPISGFSRIYTSPHWTVWHHGPP